LRRDQGFLDTNAADHSTISKSTGRARWGWLGRKVDPTGVRKDARPIIDLNQVRAAVAAALRD
jgi:hypothetical protein